MSAKTKRDLEKALMNSKNNLKNARTIHDGLIGALVEIVGADHEAAKRLTETSAKFWNSIDEDGES